MKTTDFIRHILSSSAMALVLFWSILDAEAQFTDISDELGITTSVPTNYNGSGISFYDFNGDGWDDLTIGRGADDIIFLVNNEGTLETADFTIPNADSKLVNMVLWADYNRDGHPDLLVLKTNGPVELWMNDGEFNFTNVAQEAGLNTGNYEHTGAAFCDYDHDGFLDLYIAKFYHPILVTEQQYAGALYHNNGDGTFTDVTEESGVNVSPRPTFQPVFLDYNNDGHEDLYLITDRVFVENALFLNNGDGSFTNVSEGSGADLMICSMTGTVGDYDNDGDLDVYITNSPSVGSKLLTNNGNDTFTENAAEMGVEVFEIGWGSLWLDYDNDSWQDLFVGLTTNVPANFDGNRFFRNDSGQVFTDISEEAGIIESITQTYTCAMGDLNRDGYYDFVNNNRNGFVPRLYENNGGDHHYLSVSLRGVIANYDGTGSWIHCYAGGQHTVRFTLCGENLIGQNANRYIFGLGDTDTIDSLVVEWNSGTVDRYFDLSADQHILVTEGITNYLGMEISSSHGDVPLCPGDSTILSLDGFDSYMWSNGSEEDSIVISESGIYTVSVLTPLGVVVESVPIYLSFAEETEIEIGITHESCFGYADGAIEISSPSSPGIDWVAWSTADTTALLTGLTPGEYNFSVMDLYGCPYEGEVEIEGADEIVSVVVESPIACHGDSTGMLEVIHFGGNPPISIDWGESDPEQLAAGPVSWLATDASGCTKLFDHLMEEPTALSLELATAPGDEGEANGWASLTVEGGTPPYTAIWSTGQNGFTADDLAPGDYTVVVSDSRDCTDSLSFEIGSTLHTTSFQQTGCILYPNPTRGMVWLKDCPFSGPVSYRILDHQGREIRSLLNWDPVGNIDFNGMGSGIYLLHIDGVNEHHSYRVAFMP